MNHPVDEWVRGEHAAWATRDIERILSLYAEDCRYEDLAVGKCLDGHAQIRSYLDEAFTGMPDFRVELRAFFTSADRACCEGVMRGTHTGHLGGLPPPNGKAFEVRYAHVCELRDGKAVRITDYYDMVSILRQLGLLPG